MVGYKIKWEHILLVVIVMVGLAVRLYEIHYNFDGDEIFCVKLASKQFLEVILGSLQDRPHPPLYNVLLHLWIKTFGASEVSARTLSVLFSGGFLVMSYVLLRQFVARWLAFGLLSILALSPLFVYHGQQARPYALIAFLGTANLLAFIRVLDIPHDRKRVAIWVTSCALLLYAQYLGIFLIAFQIVLALLLLRSERLTIFVYGSAGSALILPWLIGAMGGAALGGTDPLPDISWMGPPSPTDFVWFYVSTFGEGPPGLQVRWLLLMLGFPGLAYIRRLVASRNLPASHVLLFLIGVGLPMIVYVVSVWGPKPVFATRQLLAAAIAFVAAIGLCIATLPRTLAAGLLLILLVWTATSLPQSFPLNTKPPWRNIAQRIDEQYGSIAVVTQEAWIGDALEYYRKLGSVRLLSELAQLEESDKILFVCRPVGSRCSNVEIESLKSRRSLLATWQWGTVSATTKFNQIRLYEVESVK